MVVVSFLIMVSLTKTHACATLEQYQKDHPDKGAARGDFKYKEGTSEDHKYLYDHDNDLIDCMS